MVLTLGVKSAVGSSSLMSIFLTKIHFYPKLFKYLIIQAMHLKEPVDVYTFIPVSIFTDIYLGVTL